MSTNGNTWTTPKHIKANEWTSSIHGWRKVTYGNGRFIAVGDNGYVSTSTDGVNWTTPKQVNSKTLYGATYGNGYYYISGRQYIGKSTDGNNWTQVSSSLIQYADIAYGNGCLVVTSNAQRGTVYVSSDNGNTWTKKERLLSSTNIFNNQNSITYGNGIFIASSYMEVVTSETGIDWNSPKTIGSPYIVCCKYCNGAFVIGFRDGSVSVSNDGKSWTDRIQLNDENGEPIETDINGVCGMQ